MPRPSARAATRVLFVIIATATFLSAAQGQAGTVRVNSDLQLIGIADLSGGGHVTWTLTGDAARSLRQRIVSLFDQYAAIPRGFAYGGNGTAGNGDGTIQGGEALAYTNFLENEVEGVRYGFSGTELRYVRIDRADLLEQGLPVDRSTDGLVGTGPTSVEPLQIRFLFNAGTTSADSPFRFSDAALAQALFRVFDLRQRQTWLAGDPWPLLQEGGWHPVPMTDGRLALWHGNDATWTVDPLTGRYDNDTTSTTRTTTEVGVPWLDLQLATSANISLRYRGAVADPNDSLRLQITVGPTYSAWSDMTTMDGDIALPSAASWRSITYNLGSYVGQRVRLRLNFTSDGANTASGFFVRDVEINGPSSFSGVIESSGMDFLVGFHSLLDFSVRSGQVHLIRTPAGEVLLWSGTHATSAPPEAFARLRAFDVLENPQLLFIFMVAAAYSIASSRRRAFSIRRRRYWDRSGVEAEEHRALRWAGRGLVALLILLYLVPSAFTLIGLRGLMISGPMYIFFAIASPVAFGLAARSASARRRIAAANLGAEVYLPSPPVEVHDPPPTPVEETSEEFEPLPVEPQQVGEKVVSAKCPECGEVQVLPEATDLRQTQCGACGALLRGIEPGLSYLVIAPPPNPAWEWFDSFVRRNVPGLAVSPRFADEMRKRFTLQGVEFYHMTDLEDAPSSVDIKRLDSKVFPLISGFMRRRSGGVVILEGLEHLVIANSFDSVVKFLKKTTDLASVHQVTLIVPVAPGAFSGAEVESLQKEFERVMNLPPRTEAHAAEM